MAIVRYYLYLFIVVAFSVSTAMLAYALIASPALHGLCVYALGSASIPLTLLYLVSNGNLVAARLLNFVGLPSPAEQFYRNQFFIEKLRCHRHEVRIDYAGQELAGLYLSRRDVEQATDLTWSICKWKEANSRKADPDHAQIAFYFARKLIATGHVVRVFLQEPLERRKKVLGERHSAVGEAYLHLGNSYTACNSALAKAAYEGALPCFFPVEIECQENRRVYLFRNKLKAKIVYLRVTALSNPASLEYAQKNLAKSTFFLEQCSNELHSNKLNTLMLSNCRDIVLAQQAQILIDEGQSEQLPVLYDGFKRPAPSSNRVVMALEMAKRNARLLSDRWVVHSIWVLTWFLIFTEFFFGYWAIRMSRAAVVAAHRE